MPVLLIPTFQDLTIVQRPVFYPTSATNWQWDLEQATVPWLPHLSSNQVVGNYKIQTESRHTMVQGHAKDVSVGLSGAESTGQAMVSLVNNENKDQDKIFDYAHPPMLLNLLPT